MEICISKKQNKKLSRIEKKKKKLNALLTVAQLNDDDVEKAKTEPEQDLDYPNDPPAKKKFKKTEKSVEKVAEDMTMDSAQAENGVDLNDNNKDYKTLKLEEKRVLSRRKKPKLVLKAPGNQASLSVYVEDRVPILFTDVQHLLLNSIIGHSSPYLPLRWCHLEKSNHISHTVVVVVEGVSLYDFCSWESTLKFADNLQHRLEVITPSLYNGSTIEELAVIPLSDLEKDSLIEQYGSMEAAMRVRKDLMTMMRAVFPIEDGLRPNLSTDKITDNFSRTQLVLSAWQLIEENYPLPLQGKLKAAYSNYVMTKDVYEPVTASSPMYAIDCEMCRTHLGPELTRITVVNEECEVIYESYVLPENKILDYLTPYSGITEEMLSNVTTRLEDVRDSLRELLPANAILVGQSLNFDLHALKMMHPYIIDTSVIFNTTGDKTRKTKLKNLAKQFLKKNIQVGDKGHCSLEDAITSLNLVKLKLTKHLAFGDAVLKGKTKVEDYEHLKTKSNEYASNIFNQVLPKDKSCLIIGSESITSNYSKYLNISEENSEHCSEIKVVTENDNLNVVENVCKYSNQYNLTLSHVNIDTEILSNVDTFTSLNSWMNKIWTNTYSKCLMVIILAGSKTCNGVLFADVKK